jgi:hypothetical protein
MKTQLESVTDEELVQKFRLTAQKLGDIVVNWLPGGSRVTRQLFAVRNVLRHRGTTSRLKLAELLGDHDRFVRYYAARELYGPLPQQCRPVIEENTREFDAIAGDARHFLRGIDEGTYKPQ